MTHADDLFAEDRALNLCDSFSIHFVNDVDHFKAENAHSGLPHLAEDLVETFIGKDAAESTELETSRRLLGVADDNICERCVPRRWSAGNSFVIIEPAMLARHDDETNWCYSSMSAFLVATNWVTHLRITISSEEPRLGQETPVIDAWYKPQTLSIDWMATDGAPLKDILTRILVLVGQYYGRFEGRDRAGQPSDRIKPDGVTAWSDLAIDTEKSANKAQFDARKLSSLRGHFDDL